MLDLEAPFADLLRDARVVKMALRRLRLRTYPLVLNVYYPVLFRFHSRSCLGSHTLVKTGGDWTTTYGDREGGPTRLTGPSPLLRGPRPRSGPADARLVGGRPPVVGPVLTGARGSLHPRRRRAGSDPHLGRRPCPSTSLTPRKSRHTCLGRSFDLVSHPLDNPLSLPVPRCLVWPPVSMWGFRVSRRE